VDWDELLTAKHANNDRNDNDGYLIRSADVDKAASLP
jgi:hypothetical protein